MSRVSMSFSFFRDAAVQELGTEFYGLARRTALRMGADDVDSRVLAAVLLQQLLTSTSASEDPDLDAEHASGLDCRLDRRRFLELVRDDEGVTLGFSN